MLFWEILPLMHLGCQSLWECSTQTLKLTPEQPTNSKYCCTSRFICLSILLSVLSCPSFLLKIMVGFCAWYLAYVCVCVCVNEITFWKQAEKTKSPRGRAL